MSATPRTQASIEHATNIEDAFARAVEIAETLERELAAAQCPHVVTSREGTAHCSLAERDGRELAKERARLDWIEKRGPWDSWDGRGDEGEWEASVTLRSPIREIIDAAMKEENK